MNCEAIIILGWTTKESKDKGKEPEILAFIPKSSEYRKYKNKIREEVEDYLIFYQRSFKNMVYKEHRICGGEIKSKIAMEQIPYYGGVEHEIKFSYVCTVCGNTVHHKRLPQTIEELNSLITDWIKKL
jgi:hypothetical protein